MKLDILNEIKEHSAISCLVYPIASVSMIIELIAMSILFNRIHLHSDNISHIGTELKSIYQSLNKIYDYINQKK